LPTPEVDVSGGEVVDAFVVALMVVVIDERLDLRFQTCWKEVVFRQIAVLQGLVLSLDLAECLRVIWRSLDGPHFLIAQGIVTLSALTSIYSSV